MPSATVNNSAQSAGTGDPEATVDAGTDDAGTEDSAGLGDLMHAAFRGLRGRWMQQLAPFELTPHQYRALNAAARKAGADAAGAPAAADSAEVRAVRLKDLADRLHIAPRSATEVVDQLEEKGLLTRTPDPSDRRATLITLTDAGTELRERIRSVRRREADEYFSALSPGDRAELQRILGQLAG